MLLLLIVLTYILGAIEAPGWIFMILMAWYAWWLFSGEWGGLND